MPVLHLLDRRAGRAYFAVQAIAGAAWWAGVALSPGIRSATLGRIDPVLMAWLDIPLFVIASAFVACGLRAALWVVAPWTLAVSIGMAWYATATATGEAGWGALAMIAAAGGTLGAGALVRWGRLPVEWALRGPFAFRPSAPASRGRHVGRTLAQLIMFWGLFLVVLPALIVVVERRWGLHVELPVGFRAAGLAVLIAASGLGVWSAVSMSTSGEGTPLPALTARRLVISGPYAFVRNPMALAGIAQGAAVGMLLSSWPVIVYALCGSIIWNTAVRPPEEDDLRRRFGDEFDRYAAAVRCWLPRALPYRPLT